MQRFAFIFAILPVAFLYTLMEIQNIQPFVLTIVAIIYILFLGFITRRMPIGTIFLTSIISMIISVVLGMFFIEDTWWFKPFGRDIALALMIIPIVIGQLLVRFLANHYIER
jgi:hypothetical protein